jgi:K+-transporting ATPase ATPase C chain
MLNPIRAAIVILLLMTLLTGLAYPLAMVGAAGVIFPDQAAGSPVVRDGKVVGANLIGQAFAEDRYFHGRPSATGDKPYDAANSSGSNLGPTSKALIERVTGDVGKLGKGVPVDLVTTSASGLDPHISPAAAAWQVPRVAKARGLQEADLQRLVGQYTIGRELGVLGEPRVNVLRLNLALDALAKR